MDNAIAHMISRRTASPTYYSTFRQALDPSFPAVAQHTITSTSKGKVQAPEHLTRLDPAYKESNGAGQSLSGTLSITKALR